MPYFGGGLHLLIAIFFAVHVVRTGREYYWLFILFFFPLLGSAVYLFAVYLPDMRLHHGVRRATSAAFSALDPGKDLRVAERAFEHTPTAQNQMRLANALLEAGEAERASEHFDACLKGPLANDLEIRFGAAKARVQCGRGGAALELLEAVRKQHPEFRQEQTALLLARAYALASRPEDARNEFTCAVTRFGGLEARVEYAIWARSLGDMDTANAQYEEVQRVIKGWGKQSLALHRPTLKRLEAAFTEPPRV